ncbi:MAG: SUMF1/EgtB/PvdO family nonheme iron enzyme [Bryobacteraceae bacterium]
MSKRKALFAGIGAMSVLALISLNAAPSEKELTNSIGMKLVRIEPGTFTMGFTGGPIPLSIAGKEWRANGDFDERPAHTVRVSNGFYLGAFEVTNAQYEQFDPAHRALRGKAGLSKEDNEAVAFVDWNDANRFCQWLSKKEGKPYRLPTEAEWEYAARAGTKGHFFTGDNLPAPLVKNAAETGDGRNTIEPRYPPTVPVNTEVGKTPANPWGLYDMLGNVEEWVSDWYGPYQPGDQTDPVGRAGGDFRVTRGGSHSTEVYFLRSENRMGTLPEDKQGLIGFRVVQGALPKTKPVAVEPVPLNQRNVSQSVPRTLRSGPDPAKPYFHGPQKYVKIAPDSWGPMFSTHNHDPGLTECPNGDLLAIWYTCVREPGRELGMVASRLRYGQKEWDDATPFWDAPDRNDHAPALWFDGKQTLFQFNGMSAAGTYRANLALVMRTSKDSGATWSKARLILPEHVERHMPIQSVFHAADGSIVLASDANPGSTVIVSKDNGKTWAEAGGKIAGIHAGVVQLKDGSLMALGRGDDIDGFMPKSISKDMGKSWTYSASPFQPVRGGQRPVLIRLAEGPLLFISFGGAKTQPGNKDMMIKDASGKERPVSGLFAALSYDEGETWPMRKLVSDYGADRELESMDKRVFTMGSSSAENFGYMAVDQGVNGVIHLISSKNYYAFNLNWLKTPAPALP